MGIDSPTTHKINSKMLRIALIAVCLAVAAASPIDLSGYTEDQKAVISFQLALANELAAPEVPGLAAHQAAEAAVLAQQGKNPGLIKHNLGLARCCSGRGCCSWSLLERTSRRPPHQVPIPMSLSTKILQSIPAHSLCTWCGFSQHLPHLYM